ncbi:DUF84 family protein [Halalkalibacterium halodurans]|uniref:DUF84 family protein n=1 Tax=Halalkalibacterium halodurans TaxID=86665 RepID=UPI002AAA42A7|nr:DUF84 family protein [Halalkalibacterium halodurans]MDY7223788.1 DUF84 family protein [Halalkalibacterium halodurans]MDY7243009.1 DUF84 family protein [Halalkalibacterium halodurans]MED4079992.1 DUF84 family protein [Halalkalibacterium halodurans]MED4084436.1 DUF84 family protein [Halalkalibacterium halodurans]MED4104968.1 DUF84 family protein [Halalkalibacterium halodurans]
MWTIMIGSKNRAKVHALQEVVIRDKIIVRSEAVSSDVASQPFSDQETIQGAINRANHCLSFDGVDYGVGLEGGVVRSEYGLFLCNWGALVSQTGDQWVAGGARVPLPQEVAHELEGGKELGDIMESLTKNPDVRMTDGAIGYLTDGEISRKAMFQHVVHLLIGQARRDGHLLRTVTH